MKKANENGYTVRVPKDAVVRKIIFTGKQGFSAVVMDWKGIPITYLRTDFLGKPERVDWKTGELPIPAFYEEISEEILDSIQKNKGIFLSQNFLTTMGLNVSLIVKEARSLSYEEAFELSAEFSEEEVTATIQFGAVYDLVGKWLIATGILTEEQWLKGPKNPEEKKHLLERDHGGWCLEELLGDVFQSEWTREMCGNYHVARSGIPHDDGETMVVQARERYGYNPDFTAADVKCRVMFYF